MEISFFPVPSKVNRPPGNTKLERGTKEKSEYYVRASSGVEETHLFYFLHLITPLLRRWKKMSFLGEFTVL